MTTQPACAAFGAYSAEIEPPAENKPICALEKSNSAKFSTRILLSLNLRTLPAERSLANKYNSPTGKFRSSKTCNNVSPTAPVAPTIAISKTLDSEFLLILFLNNIFFYSQPD